MGISHRKRLRRHVEFYQTSFGFYEPFKILVDGTFLHQLGHLGQGDVCEVLQSSFSKRLKGFTTPCIVNELRSLGPSFSETATAAEGMHSHKCGHVQCVSAADCIIDCVGDGNADHWWVATQDERLRKALGAIPGVPCLFLTYNGLYIETPSEASATAAKNAEDAALSVPDWEMATESMQNLNELSRERGRSIFRRKKAKGPNPLSCKKKQSKTENQTKTESKRKRRRRKPRDKDAVTEGLERESMQTAT